MREKWKVKRKDITRILICSLLIIALGITNINITNIYAIDDEEKTVRTVKSDGTKYVISSEETREGKKVILEYDNQKIEYIISDDKINKTTYEYEGKSFWGTDNYDKIESETIECSDENLNGELFAQKISYGGQHKIPDGFKWRYWYRVGSEGKKTIC